MNIQHEYLNFLNYFSNETVFDFQNNNKLSRYVTYYKQNITHMSVS